MERDQDSGASLGVCVASYDRASSSLRMSQRSLFEDSTASSATLPRSADEWNRHRPTDQARTTGALSPRWVGWLMGFPDEWTSCAASETPWSPKSVKSSGSEPGSSSNADT